MHPKTLKTMSDKSNRILDDLIIMDMDGQLIVVVKIHARWTLEITIIKIQWDLRPVIWEFLLITSIIVNVLLVHSITTLFFKNDD